MSERNFVNLVRIPRWKAEFATALPRKGVNSRPASPRSPLTRAPISPVQDSLSGYREAAIAQVVRGLHKAPLRNLPASPRARGFS